MHGSCVDLYRQYMGYAFASNVQVIWGGFPPTTSCFISLGEVVIGCPEFFFDDVIAKILPSMQSIYIEIKS